jgi:hypothetical protein
MAKSMRSSIIRKSGLAALLVASAACLGWKQQTAVPGTSQVQPASEDIRSSKQKLLEDDAEKLVAMATQLKVEVDKTNKNILSLQVVRTAEEIEALAHKMKEQGKR